MCVVHAGHAIYGNEAACPVIEFVQRVAVFFWIKPDRSTRLAFIV